MATISSGLGFFLGILGILQRLESLLQGGPLFRGQTNASIRIDLDQVGDEYNIHFDTAPFLSNEHVPLIIRELIATASASRVSTFTEDGTVAGNVRICDVDYRGLYAIRDDYWPSVGGYFEKRPPITTYRNFTTDRDALRFELNELRDMEDSDAECYGGDVDPADRIDEVTGAHIVEMFGPLPSEQPSIADRRAA